MKQHPHHVMGMSYGRPTGHHENFKFFDNGRVALRTSDHSESCLVTVIANCGIHPFYCHQKLDENGEGSWQGTKDAIIVTRIAGKNCYGSEGPEQDSLQKNGKIWVPERKDYWTNEQLKQYARVPTHYGGHFAGYEFPHTFSALHWYLVRKGEYFQIKLEECNYDGCTVFDNMCIRSNYKVDKDMHRERSFGMGCSHVSAHTPSWNKFECEQFVVVDECQDTDEFLWYAPDWDLDAAFV
jgi:hypothetical protein